MRQVVNTSEVAHLWAHQTQSHARNQNYSFYFHGVTIYSYGSHFPIARFVTNDAGERAVLFTTRTYSNTTNRHCSDVSRSIPRTTPVFRVPLRDRAIDPINFLEDYRERIDDATKQVAKARIKRTREYAYSALVSLVEEASSFSQFFGLTQTFSVPEDFEQLRATLKQEAARQERIKRDNADRIARWIAGDKHVQIPHNLKEIYLRIEGDEVVTSRGARFPTTHARKGLLLVERVRYSGQPYQRTDHSIHLGHYVIDKIDTEGNVTAGCHYVKYSEIARIAPQLQDIRVDPVEV